jgi:hypothetical protein
MAKRGASRRDTGNAPLCPTTSQPSARFSGTVFTMTDTAPVSGSNFFVSINWGDGLTSPGSVTGSGTYSVSGTHVYSANGTYTVTSTYSATMIGIGDGSLSVTGTNISATLGTALNAKSPCVNQLHAEKQRE